MEHRSMAVDRVEIPLQASAHDGSGAKLISVARLGPLPILWTILRGLLGKYHEFSGFLDRPRSLEELAIKIEVTNDYIGCLKRPNFLTIRKQRARHVSLLS